MTPSFIASSNSSFPWLVRSTGISLKDSRLHIRTSATPARTAARAASSAVFCRRGFLLNPPRERHAGRVKSDEPAADHDDPLAEVAPVPVIDIDQEIDRLDETIQPGPLYFGAR